MTEAGGTGLIRPVSHGARWPSALVTAGSRALRTPRVAALSPGFFHPPGRWGACLIGLSKYAPLISRPHLSHFGHDQGWSLQGRGRGRGLSNRVLTAGPLTSQPLGVLNTNLVDGVSLDGY